VIEVEDLRKSFGAVRALDGVSFKASDGRITGLLGPNGAGKSTCLRILSTVLKPEAGTARIGGIELAAAPLAARRVLGVLPHSSGLYQQLTARENIEYYGRLHGLEESAHARCDAHRAARPQSRRRSQGQRLLAGRAHESGARARARSRPAAPAARRADQRPRRHGHAPPA
jgi:ABC-type Fe3+/spermidine/putrescine transport system ATPase subunit